MTAVLDASRVRARQRVDTLLRERACLSRELAALRDQLSWIEEQISRSRRASPGLEGELDELLARLGEQYERDEQELSLLERRASLRARSEAFEYERAALIRRDRKVISRLFMVGEAMREAEHIERARATIFEVAVVSLGCEQVGLFEREGAQFELSCSLGLTHARGAPLQVGRDFIGRRIKSGEPFVCQEGALSLGGKGRAEGLSVCLPLESEGETLAVLLIYGPPRGKAAFDEADLALLELLRSRGGPLLERALRLPSPQLHAS